MTLIQPQPIPDFASLGRVHFIAIGGAGMSGVASGFLAQGAQVSGSDQTDSEVLHGLAEQGATVWVGHDPSHLKNVDTVVVSSAIHEGNPELVEARRLGLPILHRSLALSSLIGSRAAICIAGTHGKTTTSAMCVAGLSHASDPSYVIGGTMLDTGTGAHIGTCCTFIVEADESDGSFLQYPTQVAVITGIDADHLDNWGTREHYAQGFEAFATGDTVGLVILDADNEGARKLGEKLRAQGRAVMTYGETPGCDVHLSDVSLTGFTSQALLTYGDWSTTLALNLPGVHNLHNAAAAFCVGEVLEVDRDELVKDLASFHGTARRFQRVGEAGGVQVIDDYAHHPTEVAATLAAARTAAGSGRVIVCFQPHLFSRTKIFADDFGAVLATADDVVVLDVYPAREEPIEGVTGELVADAVRAHGGRVTYVPDIADAADVLVEMAAPGDLILTVGAGSVTTLGPVLVKRLGG